MQPKLTRPVPSNVGDARPADAGEFPAGNCPACARTVLAYRDYDDAGGVLQRCVHCDAVLDDVGPALLDELELFGYGFVDGDEKKGGCAITGACTLSGKKVSGPGEGGCNDGDCTHRTGTGASDADGSSEGADGHDGGACGGCG